LDLPQHQHYTSTTLKYTHRLHTNRHFFSPLTCVCLLHCGGTEHYWACTDICSVHSHAFFSLTAWRFSTKLSISPFLGPTDNQFGFKAGHSTDQCTFLLKQTASYVVTYGSSVHAIFLDASKAFDRVW